MAKKMDSSEMAREIRALTATIQRRPPENSAAFYLMATRQPKLKISPVKQRLKIAVADETCAHVEHPVKIRHVG